MTIELLRCPFCGSEPRVQPENPKVQGDSWTRIYCPNPKCLVVMADSHTEGSHFEEAAADWNKRFEDIKLKERLEERDREIVYAMCNDPIRFAKLLIPGFKATEAQEKLMRSIYNEKTVLSIKET